MYAENRTNESWAVKNIFGFLNKQIELFEENKNIQEALAHLLKEILMYQMAASVQLYGKKNSKYILIHKSSQTESCIQTEKFPDVELLEEKIGKKSSLLLENNVFVFPLRDKGNIIALLVIEKPQRCLELESMMMLLCTWLTKRLVKQDYMEQESRVNKLLSGLGNDYTAVYLINLDTDTFEIILNQSTNNVAKLTKYHCFSDYLDNYANTYVLEDDREEMKQVLRHKNLKEYFKSHKSRYFRFHSVPNSVGQTCFEAHAVRQYEENGNYVVIGFRCVDWIVNKELEYQKKLDHAYKALQKELDVITSSIPGGIKISYDDENYSFKYVSSQYARMLGYDDVEEFMEASGGTIVGIAHPDDVENGIAEALEQYSRGDSYDITYRMKCKDGSWKYIEDHGQKVINTDGEVEHWNLILDNHELVEKTIELASEKRAGEAKTAFLARMSHDIRTPLNGIIGLLEYDARHPDDHAVITANRKKAYVAAKHLLSLVNDILELNKLDDEKVTLLEEPFNFLELLHEVKTIVEMRAAEERVSIQMDDDEFKIIHPEVIGSSLHVKQIFINLITNGIKYNKVGGTVSCKVKEISQEDGKVNFLIKIADTGIGMSEEFQNSMFAPFAQEKYDARSVYQGTGLGLPIVKRLVDRMGGEISIVSKQDIGTEVTVSLSFSKSKDNHVVTMESSCMENNLEGLKVLLVEDNELNMEISRCILEDEKMIITEAYDGEQALNTFLENPEGTFDIILMDILMPVMDGLTAARKIRKIDRKDAKRIPIFAMTANAFAEDVVAAKEAGMNEHIAKPIEVKPLLHLIQQYCRPLL